MHMTKVNGLDLSNVDWEYVFEPTESSGYWEADNQFCPDAMYRVGSGRQLDFAPGDKRIILYVLEAQEFSNYHYAVIRTIMDDTYYLVGTSQSYWDLSDLMYAYHFLIHDDECEFIKKVLGQITVDE